MKLQGIWETMPVLDTVKHIMKTFDNIWKKLEILLEATALWTHLSSFMDNWDMGSMSETWNIMKNYFGHIWAIL